MNDFDRRTHDEAELLHRSLVLAQQVAHDARLRHEQNGTPDAYGHLFGAVEQSMAIMAEALLPLIQALEPPPQEILQ